MEKKQTIIIWVIKNKDKNTVRNCCRDAIEYPSVVNIYAKLKHTNIKLKDF